MTDKVVGTVRVNIDLLNLVRGAFDDYWPGCYIDEITYREYPLTLPLVPDAQTFTLESRGKKLQRFIVMDMTIRHADTDMYVRYERPFKQEHEGEQTKIIMQGSPQVNVRGITAGDMSVFATSINALVSVLTKSAEDARPRPSIQHTETEKRAIVSAWLNHAEEFGSGRKNRAEFGERFNVAERTLLRWESEYAPDE